MVRALTCTYVPRHPAQIDLSYGYSDYHFSWRHDGGKKYDAEAANYYCKSLGYGWQGVSIETPAEDELISKIIYQGHYLIILLYTLTYSIGNTLIDILFAACQTPTNDSFLPSSYRQSQVHLDQRLQERLQLCLAFW